MRKAGDFKDAAAGEQLIEAGIAVGMQKAEIVRNMRSRPLALAVFAVTLEGDRRRP